MKNNFGALLMALLADGIDSLGVKAGRAPDDSVDLVPLGQRQFSEIGPVLSRDASY
jgi:hypothetical protein